MSATDRPLNPAEARVLQRLADGSWRPTLGLGGNLALPRLHRLSRRGVITARFNPARHGFEWRRHDQESHA